MRNAYATSQDDLILNADPLELVRMAYRAAVQSVQRARRHLALGQIAERSEQISRVCAILTELAISVDHERGGDISRMLVELYDYLQRILIEANIKQSDEKLAEAERLLTTLLEGWEGCQPGRPAYAKDRYAVEAEEYVPVSCCA